MYDAILCAQLFLTCGILKSRNKLATCIDVTDDEAPTTPDIILFFTSGKEPSRHLYSVSSMALLMEPVL